MKQLRAEHTKFNTVRIANLKVKGELIEQHMSNAIFQNMISEWFPEGTEMSTEELIAINNHLKHDYVDELERDYEKMSDLEKQSYNKDNLDAFIDMMDDYDFREVNMAIKNGEFNNKAWTEPDWKWSTVCK